MSSSIRSCRAQVRRHRTSLRPKLSATGDSCVHLILIRLPKYTLGLNRRLTSRRFILAQFALLREYSQSMFTTETPEYAESGECRVTSVECLVNLADFSVLRTDRKSVV